MRFEDLRSELARRGMPVPYIDRVCIELSGHLEDAGAALEEQGHTRAEAKALAQEHLGDPLALAHALSARRMDSSICLRYPAAVAIGFPIVTFLTLAAIQLTAFVALRDSIPAGYFDSGQTAAKALIALAGLVFLHRTLRNRLGRRWVGVALLALFIVSVTSVVRVHGQPGQRMSATLRLIP